MTRLFAGAGCVLDDGPCNNCGQCHDDDEPVPVPDDDRGDEKRAAERDDELYLSVLREQGGSE